MSNNAAKQDDRLTRGCRLRYASCKSLSATSATPIPKEASFGYGRSQPDMSLFVEDWVRQNPTLVTYIENRFANAFEADDDYRMPLPCETRTYELTVYLSTDVAGRFQFSDFVQPDPNDANVLIRIFGGEVNYEDAPPGGRQRRLIEHLRILSKSMASRLEN